MIVAGLVGVVLSFAVLREREGNTEVLVATHEIRGGEFVSPSDFRSEPVTMRAALLGTVLRSSERPRVAGMVAARTIAAGELIGRSNLRPRAARHGRRAMSIPLDPARAVAGHLTAGDRVDVLFAGQRSVSIIVADAEVLAVDARDQTGIGASTSPFTVTISLTASQSQLVAAGIADGNISLARSTGATSARGTPPATLDRAGTSDPTAP